MKLRQAAALALIGWYLMAPPSTALNESRFSHWDIIRGFDTADMCQRQLDADLEAIDDAKLQAQLKARVKQRGGKFDEQFLNRWLLSLRCVSAADPRLVK